MSGHLAPLRAAHEAPYRVEFLVVTTFGAFRVHAEQCAPCEEVRCAISKGWEWTERTSVHPPTPGSGSTGGGPDPRRPIPMAGIVAGWWAHACQEGRELLKLWHDACQETRPSFSRPAA